MIPSIKARYAGMLEQEPLGALVRRHRRAAELTQEALAERAGLSIRAVRNIELSSRHAPRAETLSLLADALQLTSAEREALMRSAGRIGSRDAGTGSPVLRRLPGAARLRSLWAGAGARTRTAGAITPTAGQFPSLRSPATAPTHPPSGRSVIRKAPLALLAALAISLATVAYSARRSAGPAPLGRLVASWQRAAAAGWSLKHPEGVAVDARGNVFVADTGNNRIVRYSPDGTTVTAWGGTGERPGQFRSPDAVAVAPNGVVYVLDSNNFRVQTFSPSGRPRAQWAYSSHRFPYGYDDGMLGVDAAGDLYAGVYGAHHMLELSPSGIPRFTLGPRSAGPGHDLAVSGNRVLFFDDRFLLSFSPNGALQSTWRVPFRTSGVQRIVAVALNQRGDTYLLDARGWVHELLPGGKPLAAWSTHVSVASSAAMAVDRHGNTYVLNDASRQILKFFPGGKRVPDWGDTLSRPLSDPQAVAVDRLGDVYVADSGNNRIEELSPAGVRRRVWGSTGVSAGRFQQPNGVAVDGRRKIYVADTGNNRIQVFSGDGRYRTSWEGEGDGPAEFEAPEGGR